MVLVGLGAVSLVAVVQMTNDISRAATRVQVANTIGLVRVLRPGQCSPSPKACGQGPAAVQGVSWESWMAQAYEIPWAQLEFFNPYSGTPPTDATVVEVAWPAGQPASASWPGRGAVADRCIR